MDEATIAAWAARIKVGQMTINQIPEVYRESVQENIEVISNDNT